MRLLFLWVFVLAFIQPPPVFHHLIIALEGDLLRNVRTVTGRDSHGPDGSSLRDKCNYRAANE